MPLRLPCEQTVLSPGGLLHPYWGAAGLPRPVFTVFVVGPRGKFVYERSQIDTAADCSLFTFGVAQSLRLTLPFPRRMRMSSAAGTQTATVSFPPDGLVSLFVTDFREFFYLPRPLLGFHAPGRSAAAQRSVLGLTTFLQYFRLVLDVGAPNPEFELHPRTPFPGPAGPLPMDRSLADFITSLRGNN